MKEDLGALVVALLLGCALAVGVAVLFAMVDNSAAPSRTSAVIELIGVPPDELSGEVVQAYDLPSNYRPRINEYVALRIANTDSPATDKHKLAQARQMLLVDVLFRLDPEARHVTEPRPVWIVSFDPNDPNVYTPASTYFPGRPGVEYAVTYVDAETGEDLGSIVAGLPPEPDVLATVQERFARDAVTTLPTPAPPGISPEPTETPARGAR